MDIHAAAEMHVLLKCGKSQECLRTVTRELRLLPSQRWWEQQLKCTYTTAQRTGSEEEELEAVVQQENSLEGPGKGEAVG